MGNKKSFLKEIVSRNDTEDEGQNSVITESQNSVITKKLKKTSEKSVLKEKITFYIDKKVIKSLKILSIKKDLRYSNIVEEALKDYIRNNK